MRRMSARSEQVAEARATRARQVADECKIDELLERQPTHHGYAIDVKYHGMNWCECYHPCVCGYEHIRQSFWRDAEHLAGEHGFKDVWAEGRSGGWLVVDPQPDTDNMYEHELEEWLHERFGPFALEIGRLFAHVCERWDELARVSEPPLEQ